MMPEGPCNCGAAAPPAPDPVAGLRDWAAARRGVADRWAKVADSYGKPASAVEVAAAVRYDDGYDLNNPNLPERYHRLLYDRRALLNVIAALLDSDRLDVERLRKAHRNLFEATGQGLFGGYIDALIAEYARLGEKP